MTTQRTTSRLYIIVAFIALSFLVLAIILLIRRSPSQQTLNVATFSKAFGNLPYYVARHNGWFEAHPDLANYRLKYLEFNDRATISEAFDSGSLDILFSAEAPAILCRAQGNDIRLAAVSGKAAQEIVVRSDSPIQSISDLEDRSVAVLGGTSSHFCLLKLLSNVSLSRESVSVVLMPPTDARTAFEERRIDAWAVWAPFVENAQYSLQARVMSDATVGIFSVMTLHRRVLNDPMASKALVDIISRAKDWIIQNPSEAKVVAMESLDLDREIVELAWPKFDWTVNLGTTATSDFMEKAEFLEKQEQSRAGAQLSIDDIVDSRFMEPQ